MRLKFRNPGLHGIRIVALFLGYQSHYAESLNFFDPSWHQPRKLGVIS
jgi:hypothetical protein